MTLAKGLCTRPLFIVSSFKWGRKKPKSQKVWDKPTKYIIDADKFYDNISDGCISFYKSDHVISIG